jgi:hypothetical protein
MGYKKSTVKIRSNALTLLHLREIERTTEQNRGDFKQFLDLAQDRSLVAEFSSLLLGFLSIEKLTKVISMHQSIKVYSI